MYGSHRTRTVECGWPVWIAAQDEVWCFRLVDHIVAEGVEPRVAHVVSL